MNNIKNKKSTTKTSNVKQKIHAWFKNFYSMSTVKRRASATAMAVTCILLFALGRFAAVIFSDGASFEHILGLVVTIIALFLKTNVLRLARPDNSLLINIASEMTVSASEENSTT